MRPMRKRLSAYPMVLAQVCLTLWATARTANADPILVDPDRFRVNLFAEFGDGIPGGAADDAFQMTFVQNGLGFLPGMYVTGGPGHDARIFRVDPAGNVAVVSDEFIGSEGMLIAQEPYGSGLLVAEPNTQRIRRILPDGSVTTFANVGTPPFGPTGMTYGPDGLLYVADFTGGTVLRVNPDGTSTVFAVIGDRVKAIQADPGGRYGGAFVVGVFNFASTPTGAGTLYSVSADGATVTPIVAGLDGIELVTPGPGGPFGDDYFVSTIGTAGPAPNGVVYTLTPEGLPIPFLTGINAVHVAFDTSGMLGGGMFVMELDDSEIEGPSRIWRVEAVPEPSAISLVVAGLFAAYVRRRTASAHNRGSGNTAA